MLLGLSDKHFPAGTRKSRWNTRKMASLCKGSWPVGPEGLSSPFHETRRNPLAKQDCIIANWLRHCRHTGRRRNAANRMQSIRRKQQKRRWRKFISVHAFFLFSLRPWCSFSSPQPSCGNNPVRPNCMSHSGCRDDVPAAGVQGLRKPLPRNRDTTLMQG